MTNTARLHVLKSRIEASDKIPMITRELLKLPIALISGDTADLLRAFQMEAEKQGWEKLEIGVITKEAIAGDRDHLVKTLCDYCNWQA